MPAQKEGQALTGQGVRKIYESNSHTHTSWGHKDNPLGPKEQPPRLDHTRRKPCIRRALCTREHATLPSTLPFSAIPPHFYPPLHQNRHHEAQVCRSLCTPSQHPEVPWRTCPTRCPLCNALSLRALTNRAGKVTRWRGESKGTKRKSGSAESAPETTHGGVPITTRGHGFDWPCVSRVPWIGTPNPARTRTHTATHQRIPNQMHKYQ